MTTFHRRGLGSPRSLVDGRGGLRIKRGQVQSTNFLMLCSFAGKVAESRNLLRMKGMEKKNWNSKLGQLLVYLLVMNCWLLATFWRGLQILLVVFSLLTQSLFSFVVLSLKKKHKSLVILNARNKKSVLQLSRSISEPNIDSNGNGATECARILLERLFAQTQKLEEHMGRDYCLSKDVSIHDLEVLESDLQNAMTTLRKEEDLQNAEGCFVGVC